MTLDLAKWGSWGGGNPGSGGQDPSTRIGDTSVICTRGDRGDSGTSVPCWRTLPNAAAEMKTNYLVSRRAFVFNSKMNNAAECPDAQPTNVNLVRSRGIATGVGSVGQRGERQRPAARGEASLQGREHW